MERAVELPIPGNPLAIRDANNAVLSVVYNAVGHRTQVRDPNMGTWNFLYNGLGEVTQQTDARGVVTSYSYDALGRRTGRVASVDIDGVAPIDSVADVWTYDPPFARGELAGAIRRLNNVRQKEVTYTYDSQQLGRMLRADTVVRDSTSSEQTFTTQHAYDAYYGRLKQTLYPVGENVQFLYSRYGHLREERDLVTNSSLRLVSAVDARGQPSSESLAGGSVVTTYTYKPMTGQVETITHSRFGVPQRALTYRYDVFGNLFEHLLNGSTSEYIVYDKLHRIESATRSGGASGVINYTYDAVGNFRSKSDFSSTAPSAYSYVGGSCGGGPNAVKSVALAGGGSRTYCYDANGNLRTDTGGFSARYDHDNLPIELARGLENTRLMYGADGEKIRQSTLDNARRHVYVDGTFEQVFTQSRGNEWKTYFGDFAVVTRTPSGSRTVEYLLKDRLGSVDSVANSQGFLVDTRAHDPFGKPRQGNWADIPGAPRFSAASMGITPRGFTQHEHLNSVEIIHMNGRAFDYSLGRFLSVDPVIQSPEDSQAHNPYAYIANRPFAGTDPTGYSCKAMTGSNICGIDTGAEGGFTSQTITLDNGEGGLTTVTETYTTGGGVRPGTTSISVSGTGLNGSMGQGSAGATRMFGASSSVSSLGSGAATGSMRSQAGWDTPAISWFPKFGALVTPTLENGMLRAPENHFVGPFGPAETLAWNGLAQAMLNVGRALWASLDVEGIGDYLHSRVRFDPVGLRQLDQKFGGNSAAWALERTNTIWAGYAFGTAGHRLFQHPAGNYGYGSVMFRRMTAAAANLMMLTHEFGHLHSRFSSSSVRSSVQDRQRHHYETEWRAQSYVLRMWPYLNAVVPMGEYRITP
ncbi:MAG: hypothetical protein LW860_19225 [Xanthomonadaceae bacterium]|nr:hypothetical protein [Xanthomonadaceae bacterium]